LILDTGCWILDTRYRMHDAGSPYPSQPDTGYWMLDEKDKNKD